jgi:hypothetical protein
MFKDIVKQIIHILINKLYILLQLLDIDYNFGYIDYIDYQLRYRLMDNDQYK